MLKGAELKTMDTCVLWLETKKSTETRKNHAMHLRLFCSFCNTTPDELVKWPIQQIKQKVLEYIVHMRKNAKQKAGKPLRGTISVNSIRTYLGGVQSFLTFHDITLNWKQIYKYLPEQTVSNLRAYTNEEIKKLLAVAGLRDRALIYIMLSGGPRVGAFEDMTVGNVSTMEGGIGLLKVYPESKRDHYVTLLTPECMAAINEYLEWRKQHGEKVTAESPLIRGKFDVFSKNRAVANPIKRVTIRVTMQRLLQRAGLDSSQLQPDHSFRYYFNTALMNSDVNHEFKELMMGHSVDLDDMYYDAKTEQSRQKIMHEYIKAVDYLTINEENRLKREVTTLKQEKSELTEIVNKLSPAMSKIQEALRKEGISV